MWQTGSTIWKRKAQLGLTLTRWGFLTKDHSPKGPQKLFHCSYYLRTPHWQPSIFLIIFSKKKSFFGGGTFASELEVVYHSTCNHTLYTFWRFQIVYKTLITWHTGSNFNHIFKGQVKSHSIDHTTHIGPNFNHIFKVRSEVLEMLGAFRNFYSEHGRGKNRMMGQYEFQAPRICWKEKTWFMDRK